MAKNTASVLAFEKKLAPSDGFMYGTTWDNRNKTELASPLKLQEKSVRGTISNRLKAAVKNDPLKLDAEVEKPNLQRVDSCALAMDQDTLKLSFTLFSVFTKHGHSSFVFTSSILLKINMI